MNTPKRPAVNRINTVIDCGDAQIMAEFYNGWAAVTSPEGAVFAFQEIEGYEPPVWPWEKGKQGQMIHLDFWVDNLEEGVEFALACGAVEAAQQFFTTSRTLLDPAGHPFCIDTDGEEP